MFCQSCAQPLAKETRFCAHCGSSVQATHTTDPEATHVQSTRLAGSGMTLGEDGVMRWVYALNMWRNPTLIITIWKVLMLSALAPALLMSILRLTDGDAIGAAASTFAQIYGLVAAIVTALMLMAYPLVALIQGGKYCVIFEMDQRGINHIQMPSHFARNQVLAMLTVLAGTLTGSPQTAGAGLLAGSRRQMYTSFKQVRRVVANRKRQIIHLREKVAHNQIYVEPENFDHVLAYIIEHSPQARPIAQ